MLHETLDIDGRLFLTLKTLLLKPGRLTIEYCNGKRKTYTPPLRMYLVISIIFFLLISLLGNNSVDPDDVILLNSEYYPRLMFVLLPVYALLLQLFFKGTFYISNLIFAIHIHCIGYLAFMFMIPLEVYESIHPIFIVMQFPLFFYVLIYTVFAMKNYYEQSWPKVLIRFLVTSLSYMALLATSIQIIATVVT